MARGRGSRPLKIRVTCSDLPGCGDSTGSRLHCTVGVDKPVVVQLKIRSSVVSVLISLIVFDCVILGLFAVFTYQKFCKSVRKFVVQFVFGKLRWFLKYFRRFHWLKSSLLVIISGIYIGLSGLFYNVTLVLFIVFWPLELRS